MTETAPATGVPFMDLGRHHAPIAAELRAAFDRVLGASAFILGSEVEAFEQAFAESCGVEHCIGVGSGTAALVLFLQAAQIGPGDEVIVPAHTFIASALAVKHVGAVPVCVEVQPGSGLIDPEAVSAAIGPRTAAVMAVHLYGQVCAMDELRALTDRHGLLLVEDAAQAQGARYHGKPAGGLGAGAGFSFYPSKNLGALGDAGAICTNSRELAERSRRLRDLGRWGDGQHQLVGHNERLDGLQAAFLRVKLSHLESWNQARRALAALYRQQLHGVELLEERPESPPIYHLFPIRVADRDKLGRWLGERGIGTGVHYPRCLADQPALPELRGSDVPVARDWARRELSLPLFPELRPDEIETVSRITLSAPAAAVKTADGSGGDKPSKYCFK